MTSRTSRVERTSTQYLGYVGVHTGMSTHGWSVQANERVVLAPGPGIGYDKAILLLTAAAFLEGHKPVGWFLRHALLGLLGGKENPRELIKKKVLGNQNVCSGTLMNRTVEASRQQQHG